LGQRGPAPKPSAIEAAEGFPGKRKPNPREPKPREWSASDTKSAPAGLVGRELHWWKYYCGVFGASRILTEADRTALGILASTSAQREKNDEDLRKTGTIYHVPGGSVRISPLVKIGAILFDREWKLLREFGGSPSSRTRVQVVTAEDDATALQNAMARPSQSESECDSIQ
jgi:P27 family predicted phage terminase small subunit